MKMHIKRLIWRINPPKSKKATVMLKVRSTGIDRSIYNIGRNYKSVMSLNVATHVREQLREVQK